MIVKERPILFSGEMVQAILDGRKTQTRRVVKFPEPHIGHDHDYPTDVIANGWPYSTFYDWGGLVSETPIRCPYGKPGDRLWVRETWRPVGVKCGCYEQPCDCCLFDVVYAADGKVKRFDEWSIDSDWQYPKAAERGNVTGRHMPRWASRITLEITAIRCERLQDITEDDAKAEGVMFHDGRGIGHSGYRHDYRDVFETAKRSFWSLWRRINGQESWDANPFVWVVEFKRV